MARRRTNKSEYESYLRLTVPELKQKAKTIEPVLRLGKNGLSDSVIDEIKIHLSKRHLVKIKYLPAFLDLHDRREISLKIARMCDAKLIQQVGGVLVLFKSSSKNKQKIKPKKSFK